MSDARLLKSKNPHSLVEVKDLQSDDMTADRPDYTVFCGEWNIGRIYEVRGGPGICGGFGRCTSRAIGEPSHRQPRGHAGGGKGGVRGELAAVAGVGEVRGSGVEEAAC